MDAPIYSDYAPAGIQKKPRSFSKLPQFICALRIDLDDHRSKEVAMVDRIQAFRRAILFAGALVCRCATAGNGRSERHSLLSESPRAAVAALLLPVLLATSCATAMTGRRESIDVGSTPSGAEARLSCDGAEVARGVTPATVTLQRTAGTCALTVTKAGFVDETRVREQGMNPVYWANFVTLPIIEMGIAGGTFVAGWFVPAGGGVAAAAGSAWVIDYRTGAIHAHHN
jgi:hypothetical protein